MTRYAVVLSADVRGQVLEQVLFIADDSIDNALGWEGRVLAAFNALGDTRGHAIDEDASKRVGRTLHKVVFERTYLIHYVVDDHAAEVHVVNFRHGARLPRRGEP